VSASEAIGLSGAAIAGYAYLPQITHLIRERCSSGLSERAFALWLAASALMTVHAVTIGAVVFVVLGVQQVAATGLIAFYSRRYRDQACFSHEHARHADAAPGVAGREGRAGSGTPRCLGPHAAAPPRADTDRRMRPTCGANPAPSLVVVDTVDSKCGAGDVGRPMSLRSASAKPYLAPP
jgi:uncharacterized protein with PQ loop repeat